MAKDNNSRRDKKDSKANDVAMITGLMGFDKPQPHNLDVETAILSSILRQPKPCADIVISELGEDCEFFYSHAHRIIYKAILEVYRESTAGSVDLVSIAHKLDTQKRLEEIGGLAALSELADTVASSANIDRWCSIVRGLAMLRKMIGVCAESLVKCYDTESEPENLISAVEQAIFDVRNKHVKNSIVGIQESAKEAFEHISRIIQKQEEPGISTGFPDLDRFTSGLRPGEMFVLAARPSIGKTAIALNIVRNMALNKVHPRRIAFFSLEMTAAKITERLLCTEAGVSMTSFTDGSFRPNDMQKLATAVTAYRNASIYIDPTSGLTISELRAKSRWLMATHGIDVIVIDYLQLMHAGSRMSKEDNRQQEVAEISGGLKSIAKDLNVPVLVLAQLNRDIEKIAGEKARPKLSHLRESGAIEQDADVVAFLHRNRDDTKTKGQDVGPEGVPAELIVEKNRNGRTGIVPLVFHPQLMRFDNASLHAMDNRESGGEH